MIYTMCSEDHSVWAEQARLDWSKHWLKWSVDLIVKHSTEEEQETLPYISNENIESWTGKLLIEDPQPLEADSRKFKINDVLFNKLRPYLAKVYHASFNGVSSSELLCLRPSQDLDSRFLFYVLSSKDFIDTVNAHSYGAKMPRADWEIVGHQSLPFPPLDTQRRIAEYLDEKIVLIDGLIERKRKLLDLLAEKRQTLITLAVTKGFPDSQRLENSGLHSTQRRDYRVVEGVDEMTGVSDNSRQAYGKVPLGWKLEKLKFFADIRNSNVDKIISEDEQPVRLCNYTDIYYNDHITSNIQFMEGSATEAEIERFQLRRNQVIITKDSEGWDDIGIPALVTEDMPDVLCGYHLSVFEAGSDLDGAFLAWLCQSASLNDQFKLAANGVTRFGLSQYAMKNAFIMFPSLDTQRRIAEFLDKETSQIDELVMKIRESIALLEEYRSAQITAIVKGQITEFQ